MDSVRIRDIDRLYHLRINCKRQNRIPTSYRGIAEPKNKFATEIYSSDMKVLGRYFQSKENRVFVPYDELSPNLVNALIATEDSRYRDHSGIDSRALSRVVVKTVILQQKNAEVEVPSPNSWQNSYILQKPTTSSTEPSRSQ